MVTLREISTQLRTDHPDHDQMQVSHETIKASLFVLGRGELCRELARCLRSRRTARRSQGRVESRGKLPGTVLISERPAEAEDGAVPGHREGDLITGAANCSAVGRLVERASRYVLLPNVGALCDRGSQYTSKVFRDTLTGLDLRASIGRVGSCYDCAVAESWFATLKTEIGQRIWNTREQARADAFAFIQYDNRVRRRSTIDFQTPEEADQHNRQEQPLAA